MGNLFQMLGYAMLTVAGLCIAVSLLSPGFRPDNTSVETTATLGALVSLALSAVWGGLRPAHAALLLCHQKLRLGRNTVAHDSPPYGHRALREDDLGTVSAQWLQEYRCETHQNG